MVPKLFLNIYSIIQVLSRVLLAQITLIEMELNVDSIYCSCPNNEKSIQAVESCN
jgi:hypothetical protein